MQEKCGRSLNYLGANGSVRRQFSAQAPFELLAELGDFHSGHYDEFTAQHLTRFVIIRQLARDPAILTILVPTEASVGNRFRADELEASQKRIALGYLKLLSENSDVHELFIRPEGFRHNGPVLQGPATGLRPVHLDGYLSRVDCGRGANNDRGVYRCECNTGG